MTNTDTLKTFATDYYPTREDLKIAYAVLNFYKGEYDKPAFSNLDCSFRNVMMLVEKNYCKLSV